MWNRKFDHAAFLEEEKYVWTEGGNGVFAKLVVIASLALMSGVIFAAVM